MGEQCQAQHTRALLQSNRAQGASDQQPGQVTGLRYVPLPGSRGSACTASWPIMTGGGGPAEVAAGMVCGRPPPAKGLPPQSMEVGLKLMARRSSISLSNSCVRMSACASL